MLRWLRLCSSVCSLYTHFGNDEVMRIAYTLLEVANLRVHLDGAESVNQRQVAVLCSERMAIHHLHCSRLCNTGGFQLELHVQVFHQG